MAQVDCPDYSGSRLAQHAFESKINGKSIAELRAMEAADLAEWFERVDAPRVASQAASVRAARVDDPPLGPGAGSAGGQVVATGTVRDIVARHADTGSETGRYLSYAGDL